MTKRAQASLPRCMPVQRFLASLPALPFVFVFSLQILAAQMRILASGGPSPDGGAGEGRMGRGVIVIAASCLDGVISLPTLSARWRFIYISPHSLER